MLVSNSSIECKSGFGLEQPTKEVLGIMMIILGLTSSTANLWLLSSLFLKAEKLSFIHLRLMNLSISFLGRSVLAGYLFQATSAIAGRWIFGDSCCILFAFLNRFFSISETFSLMLLTKECHNILQLSFIGTPKSLIKSTLAVWLTSLLWTILPFFNLGRYECDAAGVSCDLAWNYKTEYEFIYIVLNAVCFSGIPLVFTFWNMIFSFLPYSTVYIFSKEGSHNAAKAVLLVSILLILFWLPKGIVSASSFLGIENSEVLVFCSLISLELSGLIPILSFFFLDKQTYHILLGQTIFDEENCEKAVIKNRRFEDYVYSVLPNFTDE